VGPQLGQILTEKLRLRPADVAHVEEDMQKYLKA
jgi:hypothetical protein